MATVGVQRDDQGEPVELDEGRVGLVTRVGGVAHAVAAVVPADPGAGDEVLVFGVLQTPSPVLSRRYSPSEPSGLETSAMVHSSSPVTSTLQVAASAKARTVKMSLPSPPSRRSSAWLAYTVNRSLPVPPTATSGAPMPGESQPRVVGTRCGKVSAGATLPPAGAEAVLSERRGEQAGERGAVGTRRSGRSELVCPRAAVEGDDHGGVVDVEGVVATPALHREPAVERGVVVDALDGGGLAGHRGSGWVQVRPAVQHGG